MLPLLRGLQIQRLVSILRPGVSVIVTNPASSGKVLKINSLVASGIGATTDVTVKLHNLAAGAGGTTIATSVSVPTFSTLVVISKENQSTFKRINQYQHLNNQTQEISISVVLKTLMR